jgi:hypothetical protein
MLFDTVPKMGYPTLPNCYKTWACRLDFCRWVGIGLEYKERIQNE